MHQTGESSQTLDDVQKHRSLTLSIFFYTTIPFCLQKEKTVAPLLLQLFLSEFHCYYSAYKLLCIICFKQTIVCFILHHISDLINIHGFVVILVFCKDFSAHNTRGQRVKGLKPLACTLLDLIVFQSLSIIWQLGTKTGSRSTILVKVFLYFC